MKNKEEHVDDHDDTEEFILSIPKTKTESNATKPEHDALFGVSKKSSIDVPYNENQKKENTGIDKSEDGASQQDALFEVSEINKSSACDDDDGDRSSEKEGSSSEKKKIEELAGQLVAANDKYLRLMAEFDNYKRRSAKEYERMIQVANEKLMKDITEVRENFERAFKSKADGENLLEGMKLIFSKLNTILQKHGLEMYAEAGQKFDPEVHDALMRMPHDKIEEGYVVEVHERGYKLKGNIIKHAKVVVSSGKPQKKETEDETVIEIK